MYRLWKSWYIEYEEELIKEEPGIDWDTLKILDDYIKINNAKAKAIHDREYANFMSHQN